MTSDLPSAADHWRLATAATLRRTAPLGGGAARGRSSAERGRRAELETGDVAQWPTRRGATLDAAARQRHPRGARAHRRQPRRRPAGSGPPDAGLVGRPGRAGGRSTPTGGSSSPPTCSAAARARTGPASPPPGRPGVGQPVPVRHRPRPGAPPRPRSPTRSASTPGRCVIGGSMGGMRALEWAVTHPSRVRRRSSWRAPPPRPPSRSPGASRSCWPSARTRTSTAATTTTRAGHGPARRAGHGPADRPRDLPQRARARRRGSAAGPGR